jgi:hypothetical protein
MGGSSRNGLNSAAASAHGRNISHFSRGMPGKIALPGLPSCPEERLPAQGTIGKSKNSTEREGID